MQAPMGYKGDDGGDDDGDEDDEGDSHGDDHNNAGDDQLIQPQLYVELRTEDLLCWWRCWTNSMEMKKTTTCNICNDLPKKTWWILASTLVYQRVNISA